MKNYLALILGLGLLLAGCASGPTPDVTTHYDYTTGLRTDLMGENLLEAPGQTRELVWLNASRVYRNPRDAQYYLEVQYMARADVGYLEIPSGETLTLVLNGRSMKFSGTGSANTRQPYQKELVRETAIYPATRVQLQTIALATNATVEIRGINGLVQRRFSEENVKRFRHFVTRFAL